MVNLAKLHYPAPKITYYTDVVPGNLILYADEHLIIQVFINILKNAIQAMADPQNGVIRIRATIDSTEAIAITICNHGPVVTDEIATNIFIPFFTTKSDGSGIGLSISRHIKLSGGNLSLKIDKKNRTTTFILTFK